MAFIENRWDESAARGLNEPELLVYRSNLLGADPRVTNYGGGNTSAKLRSKDPLTAEEVEVLWVKGSGGDLGTIGLPGFSTLYMQKLLALQSRYTGIAADSSSLAAHGTTRRGTTALGSRRGSAWVPARLRREPGRRRH